MNGQEYERVRCVETRIDGDSCCGHPLEREARSRITTDRKIAWSSSSLIYAADWNCERQNSLLIINIFSCVFIIIHNREID